MSKSIKHVGTLRVMTLQSIPISFEFPEGLRPTKSELLNMLIHDSHSFQVTGETQVIVHDHVTGFIPDTTSENVAPSEETKETVGDNIGKENQNAQDEETPTQSELPNVG